MTVSSLPTPQESAQRSYRWHKERLTALNLDSMTPTRDFIERIVANLEAGLFYYARLGADSE